MKNKDLTQVNKLLNKYFSYYKSANVLVVSEDKAVLPFAYIINDKTHPNHLLLSIAVDYPYSERCVELALLVNSVKPVALTEQFFIAQNGTTYLGSDADKYYSLESDYPINDIQPFSKTEH